MVHLFILAYFIVLSPECARVALALVFAGAPLWLPAGGGKGQNQTQSRKVCLPQTQKQSGKVCFVPVMGEVGQKQTQKQARFVCPPVMGEVGQKNQTQSGRKVCLPQKQSGKVC